MDLWQCLEDGESLRAERSHATPVLTVLLSGACVLRDDRQAVIVEAGTAVLAHSDFAYRSEHPFGCGDTGCHVRPSPRLLREIDLPRARRTLVPIDIRGQFRFRLAVERVAAHGAHGLELEEACLALFASTPDMRAPESPAAVHRRHVDLVEAAKALLLRRFAEPLSLDDLARALGASPFHLARIFRRITGFSLHGYRTRIRLLHSLDRLEESRGALTDLALELGFSSQSHFTDAFRRAFGLPPGALGRAGVTRCARVPPA